MTQNSVPEFAILGHPNEGKSSVVSTLAEDDSVRIGPVPGETIVCQTFPVEIDGREVIRFVDTPGFQNPRKTLAWMQSYTGSQDRIVEAFIKAHGSDPAFRDECELLGPVARGAGIIYVVDGSRPVRNDDRAEMEILRLTGSPRMSIINSKSDDDTYLEQWKNEFRKHFNSIRTFNAHTATYAERIALLESLKSVDQDWEPALTLVIDAFRRDWEGRCRQTAQIMVDMVSDILSHTHIGTIAKGEDLKVLQQNLEKEYRISVEIMEKKAFQQMRRLFRHNIFNVDIPFDSLLHETLFSEKTWMFLGLTPKEAVIAAGLAGGAAGAALDVAAAGITFGVFTALGGVLGAGSALLSGNRMAGLKVKGVKLGQDQLRIGPAVSIQFMYVLLDRSLLYFSSIINWAHGRRDRSPAMETNENDVSKKGFTVHWDAASKASANRFFAALRSRNRRKKEQAAAQLKEMLFTTLIHLSS